MARKLFVNIAVADLKASIAFFTHLGFAFDARFTDENASCMLVGEDAYFMLLTKPRIADFMKNTLVDSHTHTEALFALSCESRAEVDALVAKAVAAGGSHAVPPQDHGFMYGWSFKDLDGHHFEVFWMDPSALQ